MTSRPYSQVENCNSGGVDVRVDAYLEWIAVEMDTACAEGRRPGSREAPCGVGAESDAGVPDGGSPDMGLLDVGLPDMGAPNASSPDAGPASGGVADAGAATAPPPPTFSQTKAKRPHRDRRRWREPMAAPRRARRRCASQPRRRPRPVPPVLASGFTSVDGEDPTRRRHLTPATRTRLYGDARCGGAGRGGASGVREVEAD